MARNHSDVKVETGEERSPVEPQYQQAEGQAEQTEPSVELASSCQRRSPGERERPPKLARRIFPSSDSSSQYEDDGWKTANREDSRCSEPGTTTESWEFKSTQEAPIARLESLDELETSQVRSEKYFQIIVVGQTDSCGVRMIEACVVVFPSPERNNLNNNTPAFIHCISSLAETRDRNTIINFN